MVDYLLVGMAQSNYFLTVQSNWTSKITITITVHKITYSAAICQLISCGQLVQGVSIHCYSTQS